ncbi:MAG: hypothetical protein H6718_28645 [Polyangiaceae bacterium]|nr:hypothetical protein [Myxococcales bacterium]MCB9589417.1 hypothetical protein [Polyangiaceae bacterium]
MSHASAQAAPATTQDTGELPVTDPGIYPTPLWALSQLLPSPEWTFRSEDHYFGLRWRVTPLLYSYVTDRRLSRWRSLIAEPVVRHGGSFEWFITPGFAFGVADGESHFSARSGLRGYFPLIERGEYLSLSLGAGVDYRTPDLSPIAELGLYSLFGGLGLVGTHARFGDFTETSVRLQLGYF